MRLWMKRWLVHGSTVWVILLCYYYICTTTTSIIMPSYCYCMYDYLSCSAPDSRERFIRYRFSDIEGRYAEKSLFDSLFESRESFSVRSFFDCSFMASTIVNINLHEFYMMMFPFSKPNYWNIRRKLAHVGRFSIQSKIRF